MKYLRLIKDLPTNKAGEIRALCDWYGYGRERHFPEEWVESKIWFEEATEMAYRTQGMVGQLKEYEQFLLEDK